MSEVALEPRKPIMRLKWKRWRDHIMFNRPSTYLILGQRGTGKSSLLERIASQYPKVFDLFGSVDNESLAWCKPNSPFKNILFLTGDGIKVTSQWDSMPASALTLNDIEAHDAIIMCHAFFDNEDAYFATLQNTCSFLWGLRRSWREPWFICIREAANWIYARMQIVKDSQMAKAYFVMMLREARHGGLAVGVDTLRWTSLDKEVRDISDYLFIKRVGNVGLPRDLWYIYKYATPRSLMWLPPSKFALITGKGSIAFGSFKYPAWHKEESEDLLTQFDIKVEVIEGGASKKSHSGRMAPEKHYKILKDYLSTDSAMQAGLMNEVSQGTVSNQKTLHNHYVLKGIGYCELCKPIDEEFARKLIVKGE